MTYGAGHFEDRLIWMQQSVAPSGRAGAVAETFTEMGTIWCAMEMPTGAEKIQWSSLQTTIDYRVRLHGDHGVKAVDRFKDPDDDTVYVINGVHLEDGNQVCMCVQFTEQVSAGVP